MGKVQGILGAIKGLESTPVHLLAIGLGIVFLFFGTSRKLNTPVKVRKILNPIGIVLGLLGLALSVIELFVRRGL